MAVMAVFSWTAYRVVEMALVRTAGDRAQRLALDLADLVGRTMHQTLDDLDLFAARAELRDFVRHPDQSEFADALRARLNLMPIAGARRIEIWDNNGHRIFSLLRTAPGMSSDEVLPPTSPPSIMGYAPMKVAANVAFTDISDEIRDGPGADARRLGFILVRATVTPNSSDAVRRIIGSNSQVLLGNRTGDVWTDLGHVVPAPLVKLRFHDLPLDIRRFAFLPSD